MSKVSNTILSLLAATLLLFGINLSLQSARAIETNGADCIVAHSGPAPPGQHWDLRGKCWYLHAGAPLMHHAATRPRAKAATLVHHAAARRRAKAATRVTSTAATHTKTPQHNPHLRRAPAVATVAAKAGPPATAAVPVADAPPPAGPTDGVQPQPHIEILRTVPVGVPTQEAAQPSAPAAQVAPATQGGSATAVSNGASMGNADAVASSSGSDVKNAASAVHEAEPDAERSGPDAAQQKPAEAPGLADTIATLQPTEMFFLLAIGLSMVVFLIAIASRIAAKRREPFITDYRDSASSNERFDPPQVDDAQFADEVMDEQRIDEEQDVPFIDPQALASSSAAPSEPDPKGLEPVLRILRQA
jgi:hypothetical protein